MIHIIQKPIHQIPVCRIALGHLVSFFPETLDCYEVPLPSLRFQVPVRLDIEPVFLDNLGNERTCARITDIFHRRMYLLTFRSAMGLQPFHLSIPL